MSARTGKTKTLRPAELEAVYAISRIVAETLEIDKALAEIIGLARTVFIFDNAVLYLYNEQTDSLEPAFARAIGRGRSSEADSAWGEMAATQAFKTGKNLLHQPKIDPDLDRLKQRFYLGLPLLVAGKTIGALAFIRFGGPTFTEDQITLAEFMAVHVTQVLEHQRLVERIATLEADRRLARMQSDFIATVSHELKTPLGFIKGYSSTLLRRDTEWDPATRNEFLTVIDEESDHLTDLVDNLLDSSRLQSGTLELDFQEVELAPLFEDLLPRLTSRYPEIKIKLDNNPVPTIQADPVRLAQVLENLVNNAAKYAAGSELSISVKDHPDRVLIILKDEGPGIPEEHIQHVFKRFYRVPTDKEKTRGSGLGLYICQQIVNAHGGAITLRSQPGEGAEFIIDLPKQTRTEHIS